MPRFQFTVQIEAEDVTEAERITRFSLRMAGADTVEMSMPVQMDSVATPSKEAKKNSEVALTTVTMATVKGLAMGMTFASEIAKFYDFSHQGVLNRFHVLEEAGWIERIPEPDMDARLSPRVRLHYRLTKYGIDRMDELVPDWRSDA